jgi:hypothetical protein
MKIKINDNAFLGDLGCSKYYAPTKFEWYRGPKATSNDNNIIFYTDGCLSLVDLAPKDSFKVAWLVEPYVIFSYSYNYVQVNYDKFDLILTHNEELVKLGPKVRWYPFGSTWIDQKDWKQYDKSDTVCIIASNKNFTIGHQIRHQLINKSDGLINVYGSGYKPIKDKIDVLKTHRFSFAIENCNVDTYFTEKLIDCFATYTVPIYYGTKNIGKIFNPNGIIFFDDIDPILTSIKNWSETKYFDQLYHQMLPAVKENFEIAKSFRCAEDWLYDNILKDHLNV